MSDIIPSTPPPSQPPMTAPPKRRRIYYPIRSNQRQMCIDILMDIMQTSDSDNNRINAAAKLLQADALNLASEKLDKGMSETHQQIVFKQAIINMGPNELQSKSYDDLLRLHNESLGLIPSVKTENRADA